MASADLSIDEARRIALTAQGFDRPRPTGRVDVRHLRRTILQLGLLQIDYVNVLVPAHYQVPYSRLGPYERTRLDDLVYRRREFMEQWAHEASIVPVACWPLLRHRRETHRVRPWGFEKFLKKHARYADDVLHAVRARGPLSPDDVAQPNDARRHIRDQWGWGQAVRKQVFEAHFGFGRLAVAERRPNMSRVYDLAERVVPTPVYRRTVDRAEAQRELLRLAARAHGVGTASDLADYYRMPIRDTRTRLAELVEMGDLRVVRVERWPEVAYLHPKAKLTREVNASAVLSPFDPVVWCRPRVARLFQFDYRIEIFVPLDKRKWGYYVLPFLHGDRLVARVDLKADRGKSTLRVLAAYPEPHTLRAAVATALAAELWTLARWLGLEAVTVGRRGALAGSLSAAVNRHRRN